MAESTLTNGPWVVLTRVSTGERIELTKDATAGRGIECDIPLSQGHGSRTHARITFNEGSPWVEDLGSANGTFVNDGRILGRLKLKSGDRLRFDVEEFEVALPAPLPSSKDIHQAATRFGPMMAEPAVAPAVARVVQKFSAPVVAPVVAPAVARVVQKFSAPVVAPVVAPAVAPAVAPSLPKDSGSQKRPGAWAHATQALLREGAGSTKYILPAEIKQMMERAKAPSVSAPEEVGTPHLLIVSGNRTSVNVLLRAGSARVTEWSIGSHPERDVVLPDDGVSAFHAKMMNEDQRWKVVDQMSANGTFVNGKRSNLSYLSHGDRLRFGPVECIFQMPTARSSLGGATKFRWVGWAIALVGVLALLSLAYRMIR